MACIWAGGSGGESVRALLKLVERVRGLKVGSEEMREVFGFRDGNGDGGREVR